MRVETKKYNNLPVTLEEEAGSIPAPLSGIHHPDPLGDYVKNEMKCTRHYC